MGMVLKTHGAGLVNRGIRKGARLIYVVNRLGSWLHGGAFADFDLPFGGTVADAHARTGTHADSYARTGTNTDSFSRTGTNADGFGRTGTYQ